MTPLHLRVDVCTYRGLRDGVPGVLDVLSRSRARATFFVAFGPDASGLAMRKLLDPSFALKMLRTRAVGSYGLATALYGTLLPSPLVGAGLPEMVWRIRDAGHEVGMHGWDHRRWQDGLGKYGSARLSREFERMRDAYERIVGTPGVAFAAPAWCVTRDLLDLEERAGLAYAADARGSRPFLPTWEGRDYAVPQLPVSLPTLDEALVGMPRERFAAQIAESAAQQAAWCCYAAHAETEGRAFRAEFAELLARVDRPVLPLGEAPRHGLPRATMRPGRVPGRPYDVSVIDPR